MGASTIIAVPGLETTDLPTRAAFVATAERLRVNPDELAALISFETARTWSPKIKNPYSGATGLLQFLPSTAVALGTTTAGLATMSVRDQLVYVEKYLRPFAGRIRNFGDLCMAVFYPKMVGQPDDAVIFRAGDKGYEQNRGLDSAGTGVITRGAYYARVRALYEQANAKTRLPVGKACDKCGGSGVLPLVALVLAKAAGWLG